MIKSILHTKNSILYRFHIKRWNMNLIVHIWREFKGTENFIKAVIVRTPEFYEKKRFLWLKERVKNIARKYGQARKIYPEFLKLNGKSIESDWEFLHGKE